MQVPVQPPSFRNVEFLVEFPNGATTQRLDSQNDYMHHLAYRGPAIGFGGKGIEFMGSVLMKSPRTIDVEIGFVQTVISNQDEGIYEGGNCVRRTLDPLPMKDGEPGDIWYKPDSVYGCPLGANMEFTLNVTATDEVKGTFPVALDARRHGPGYGAITEFRLTRDFITCLAVRVRERRPGALARVFYLSEVRWKCQYLGTQVNGQWQPVPEAHQYYTIVSSQDLPSPFEAPAEIKLDGPVVNQAEKAEKTQCGQVG